MFYLDTSFIAPAFAAEARSEAVLNWLGIQSNGLLYLSSWTAAELAGAMGRKVRRRDLTATQADEALAAFDFWRNENCLPLEADDDDIRRAEAFARIYDSGLRAADALHLALAKRHGNLITVTYDEGLLKAAAGFGLNAQRGPV